MMNSNLCADVEETALELSALLRTDHDLARAEIGLGVCVECEKPLAVDPTPLLVPRRVDIDADANSALVARIEWECDVFRYDRDRSLRAFGSKVIDHWDDAHAHRQDIPLENRVRMVRPLLMFVDETTGAPRHIVVDGEADHDAFRNLVRTARITDRVRISVVHDYCGKVRTTQCFRDSMGSVMHESRYTTDTLTDALRFGERDALECVRQWISGEWMC